MKSNLFFLLAITLLNISVLAQNIKTPQDTAVLVENSKIPYSDAQFNLSYPANSFNLNFKPTPRDTNASSLEKLLQKLDKNPQDVETALYIVDKYRALYDYKNYNLYLEYAYNHAYSAYKSKPDSFFYVRQFCHVLQKTNNIDGLLGLLHEYVENHPKDIDGLIEYAVYLSFMAGEPEKAQQYVEKAYEIDPTNHLVYSAAMNCETASLLLRMGELMQLEDAELKKASQELKVNDAFFQKAIQAKNSPAAQMALDASQLYIVLYRTVFSLAERKFGEEKISVELSEIDIQILNDIEKRYLKQIKNKKTYNLFAYKTLAVIEALRGNASKVVEYWQKSGDYLKTDSDVLNWIFWTYALNLDYKNSIVYLEKKLAITNSYDDAYTIGRFYVFMKNIDAAIEQMQKTQKMYLADKRATCAIASLMIQQKKYDKALETLEYYPSETADDIKDFHINYYKAVVVLATGNKEEAFRRLEAIDEESPYKEKANKLLEHFKK